LKIYVVFNRSPAWVIGTKTDLTDADPFDDLLTRMDSAHRGSGRGSEHLKRASGTLRGRRGGLILLFRGADHLGVRMPSDVELLERLAQWDDLIKSLPAELDKAQVQIRAPRDGRSSYELGPLSRGGPLAAARSSSPKVALASVASTSRGCGTNQWYGKLATMTSPFLFADRPEKNRACPGGFGSRWLYGRRAGTDHR
jgi:hypothetical protein